MTTPSVPADPGHGPDPGRGSDPEARLVAGRYRLGPALGRGSMGTVWSARDELLGRPVAIKEVWLPPGIPETEADLLRARSLREARAIAALSHPNVITLYDVAWEGKAPFVVMELVPAHSLAELLHQGPLAPDRVATIGTAVAAALQAAHAAGITHRDVKPGNVLVAHDGRIKLTDFGIARNPADVTMTATGLMLGSPAYIAPEVASGGRVGPVADLWGLGATLFAAVEGRPPYDAGDPLATVSAVVHDAVPEPTCDGPLAEVIRGLLVKDPAARMPLAEVRRLLGGTGPAIPQPVTPQPVIPQPAGAPAAPDPVPPTPPAAMPLAAEPGPLPFAIPAGGPSSGPKTGRRRAARGATRRPLTRRPLTRRPLTRRPSILGTVLVWTLAGVLFLTSAAAGFVAARVALGAPPVPTLPIWSSTPGAADVVTEELAITEPDGTRSPTSSPYLDSYPRENVPPHRSLRPDRRST